MRQATPPPGAEAWWRRAWSFLRLVLRQAERNDLFFKAGAITFNLLVATIPLVLLLVGAAGYLLERFVDDPVDFVVGFILELLPVIEGDIGLVERVESTIGSVIEGRTGLGLAGALIFVWISTRLVGTLRTVLRDVFQLPTDRGLILGKLFDAGIVVLSTVLLLVNIGITVALRAIRDYGIELLGLEGWEVEVTHNAFAYVISFGSAWVLCLLIYRYLPKRRTPWRAAVVAATVTAGFFELTKGLFAWYVSEVAVFATAFGTLATVAVLFFWIYYSAAVFILGGHVGYVYDLVRGAGDRGSPDPLASEGRG